MTIDTKDPVPGHTVSVLKHTLAYTSGQKGRKKGALRVAPYYEEKQIIDGHSVDITDVLDEFWYAGYDGLPMPEEKL
jgi:hypothetical protein